MPTVARPECRGTRRLKLRAPLAGPSMVLSHAQLHQSKIQDDRIDILGDLAGPHDGQSFAGFLRAGAAPVQVTALGIPGNQRPGGHGYRFI